VGVAQDNMKEHWKSNPSKGHVRGHKYSEVVEFIAKEEQPKAEVQPKDPIL
jgi:hypothetical protein